MELSSQKGSIDLFYAFLCFSLLGILSLYTFKRIDQWHKLKANLAQIICIKAFHIKTNNFVKDINLLNQVIAAESIIQLASLFFPATWLSQNSLAQIKKATKKLQTLRLGVFMYEVGQQVYKGCRYDPRVLTTPYKIGLKQMGFTRTKLGTTQLKNKEWKYCHPLSYQVICSQYKISNQYSRSLNLETSYYFLPRKL